MYKQFWLDALYISLVILLPAIPAFVLYKMLPSEATASGPFKGLQVNLRGAFAGYFLLVLLFTGVILARRPPSGYGKWTVTGRVAMQRAPSSASAHATYSLQPPSILFRPEGVFTMDVPVSLSGDTYTFPTIVVEFKDHETVSIPLSPGIPLFGTHDYHVKHDAATKVITINDPIVLTGSRDYVFSDAPRSALPVTPGPGQQGVGR